MPMKHRKLKTFIVLAVVLTVWIFSRTFGPMDTYPRVQQVTNSPDGKWTFEVYHRKLKPLNPFTDAEIVFRIRDIESNKVSEQRIWRITWWVNFYSHKNFDVRFEENVIIVNDFWVAKKLNPKFEMCPLLECLKSLIKTRCRTSHCTEAAQAFFLSRCVFSPLGELRRSALSCCFCN
jgi:hypothetical protein